MPPPQDFKMAYLEHASCVDYIQHADKTYRVKIENSVMLENKGLTLRLCTCINKLE